jgi:hypothetical protein
VIILLVVFSLLALSQAAVAQNLDTCPALVNNAVTQVGINCAGMARNTACYGFRSIVKGVVEGDTAPNYTWTADQPDLGSRIDLTNTQAIQTAPFDLLNREWGLTLLELQANLPNTLASSGVRMMALGGVEVENGVEPEDALILPPSGISANTTRATNLRNNPGGDGWFSRIIGSVPPGTIFEVDIISDDLAWGRVVFNGIPAWVQLADLSSTDDLLGLPVVTPDSFTPYQDFYFRVGIGGERCADAPSLLFIQSPNNPVLAAGAANFKDELLMSPASQGGSVSPIPIKLRLFGQDIEVEGSIVARTFDPGDDLGTIVELVNLFGLLRIYPDTPGEIIVPPGFATRLTLSDPASLGIEGDDDERAPSGTFGPPFPLSQDELNDLGIVIIITDPDGGIFDYPVVPPFVIQASGVGGVVSLIACATADQCAPIAEACAPGGFLADNPICDAFGF